MKVLVLGGGNFIGRVLLEKLTEKDDHQITLFNRGKTNAELFPEIPRIIGDRETDDIQKIYDQDWDCVIDISAYHPNSLEKMLEGMEGKVGRYIFVSTGSVYDLSAHNGELFDENYKMKGCTQEQRDDPNIFPAYGEKKAECERIISGSPIDSIIFRPSIVYGRYDPYDRHYYWIYRVNHLKEILLPGKGNELSNYTYVEDLAEMMIRGIDMEEHQGVYNAVSHEPTSLLDHISTMPGLYGFKTVNVDESWLEEQDITPGKDISLWFRGNMLMFDTQRVFADFGDLFMDFEESLSKTTEFYEDQGWPIPKFGISTEREAELIKKWRKAKA